MSFTSRAKFLVLSPYIRLLRLDNLTGVYLLMWPGLWAIAMASAHGTMPLMTSLIFVMGAFLMRSSGCIINDIIDRKLDAQVKRTRERPLASGQISIWSALLLLIFLLALAASLLLFLNHTAVIMACVAVIPVVVYPYMKRITYWPQAFLAITFNWGALVGWAAIKEDISLPAYMLYAAACFWTLGYDTIYAHQDKQDDLLVGVKSTALKLGKNTKKFLYFFYGMANILLWTTAVMSGLNLWFHVILIISLLHLLWQVITLNLDDPRDCLYKFNTNKYYGALILVGILLGRS